MFTRRLFIGLLATTVAGGFTMPARATEADNWQKVCATVRGACHLGKNFRNNLLEELAALSPATRVVRLAQLGL